MWSDLEFVANIHQHGKRHFLGSIVLRDEDKVSGIQRYTVIDGQQRIITIILFMSSLISVLKESGNMDDFEGTKTKLIIRDLKNKENCIRIPMGGGIRSLNLGNSVAIVLYEALRQNAFAGLGAGGKTCMNCSGKKREKWL